MQSVFVLVHMKTIFISMCNVNVLTFLNFLGQERVQEVFRGYAYRRLHSCECLSPFYTNYNVFIAQSGVLLVILLI